jgi:hypothetical protein
VTCYNNTKIPFISSEKNGPDPLSIAGSSSHQRPRSLAKTAGSWPFPEQNGRIPPGWMGSGGERPKRPGWTRSDCSPDRTAGSPPAGRNLAIPDQNGWLVGMAGIWPFPNQIGRGLGRRGEWLGISGDMMCFQGGIFTDRCKGHFCLYVLKYFLIHFTIKLMWSHLSSFTSVSKTLLVKI